MAKLTLILGGARSGKSSYAQRLAQQHPGPVIYIATAQPLDLEMENRIENHRLDRPEDWITLEAPRGVVGALRQQPAISGIVLLDCMTLLITNLLMTAAPDEDHPDEKAAFQAVETELDQLLPALRASQADWIVVSNEVGLGLVPPYPLGRIYRDLLGRANQRLAAIADEVFWMVAGIPVPIHPYRVENQ
jgi:adenosylcobinamide kinase / adenosylcobinamide-phosphate guanylyltransferase